MGVGVDVNSAHHKQHVQPLGRVVWAPGGGPDEREWGVGGQVHEWAAKVVGMRKRSASLLPPCCTTNPAY